MVGSGGSPNYFHAHMRGKKRRTHHYPPPSTSREITEAPNYLPLEALLNVNDIVAERIEQARRRAAAKKRRRDELAAARQRGLQARHAAKLSRQSRNQR